MNLLERGSCSKIALSTNPALYFFTNDSLTPPPRYIFKPQPLLTVIHAWKNLSSTEAGWEYNNTLDNDPQTSPRPETEALGSSESTNSSEIDGGMDDLEIPTTDDPQFRYAYDDDGTEIQIKVRGWKMSLFLSNKFKFMKDITDLTSKLPPSQISGTAPRCISMELPLNRDSWSSESRSPTINELTIKVTSVPAKLQVTALHCMFKEMENASTTLTLTLHAEQQKIFWPMPWEYGFEFDMNWKVKADKVATYLIFSVPEPPVPEHHLGWFHPTPEHKLKRDEDLKTVNFVNMGAEYRLKIRYGHVTMWRLVAVGYRGLNPGFGWSDAYGPGPFGVGR
ncbi:uncharacterized protein BDR25DRAFT_313618 [Lindgomyces ingoldianus]|uniref:Uncharacterized protein n=1 Tax=Lindgomyces ingoldianus TaxID=673940 RepID=A0ACB6QXG3_9PLEO|nr:uncharacterized protein BDR25DRAFT_313618 [Lindgomyces ingoldianus]KAF2471703.1 hypothetical protein BDR25DRAFT_313618 [Lindgomyces ingoldianus]